MKITLSVSLLVAALAGAALLTSNAVDSAAPPKLALAEFETIAPALERGTTIAYRRVPCSRERAAIEAATGAPAPEDLQTDTLRTLGPLPEELVAVYSRNFLATGTQLIGQAEKAVVNDVASARTQATELLLGQQYLVASRALREGHYWTVPGNSRPQLPEHWTYIGSLSNQTTADGQNVEIFVPIDLREPELRTTYEALLSLENELRRERAAEFNRLSFDERREIVARADRARRGEAVSPELPEYFWRFQVDPTTFLASAAELNELVAVAR
ncbi:MAG: hypothetical protein IT457_14870 [Planctomycetes bacterium]|nr:hypothetical protein [Planctomycetota bacterium]